MGRVTRGVEFCASHAGLVYPRRPIARPRIDARIRGIALPSMNAMNSIQLLPSPPLSVTTIKRFKAPKTLKCCCSSRSSDENSKESSNDFKEELSGMMEEQIQELLSRKENKGLLDGLEKASLRVEMAKRELALIQKQELAAKQFKDYINQLEGKAFEIAECQREISEAKALIEEAEGSLSLNEGFMEMGMKSEEIDDRDRERWESVKAASISALVGSFAGLPICFTQVTNTTQLLLPLAINFICCALFGVTFRYTIRRNLDDVQLKTGVAAAFGVVKGLATLSGGPLLEQNFESLLSHAQDGTIYVSENLFIFVSAAVGLDYCLKTRLLIPFPIDSWQGHHQPPPPPPVPRSLLLRGGCSLCCARRCDT